jgi:Transcription factor zinc-finger
MADEKDRYGEKIHDRGKVHEDQWARDQDQKLLDKLRQIPPAQLHCPQCNRALVAQVDGGLDLMSCSEGHGAWIDQAALKPLLMRLK